MTESRTDFDIFVIGGGINGCGIARDAAGRGLKVGLAEKDDLASATSSSSTKLFHGGLRYLEYFEFRLVREALTEREVLLRAMPHISWPMRFVLPYAADMRFDSDTPTSRLLGLFMPWLKGRRPAWLIRLGLFLYDHLGGRKLLPGTSKVRLKGTPEGAPLKDRFRTAWEYSDCWVQDSRLVALNARDAAAKGAAIMTRTRVTVAKRVDGIWRIGLQGAAGDREVTARALVNAAGPWAGQVIHDVIHTDSRENVRLVRGSHLVVRSMFDHGKCYFLQGTDGRIIFAIPYEGDFTLIGTTDREHASPDERPVCTEAERDYLLAFANAYFRQQLTPADVVWSYSGVRPLYDDGARSATAATRDYVLKVDAPGSEAPLLNIFGGKITTYRRLAEHAMEKLAPYVRGQRGAWTAGAPLPGGDFPVTGVAELISRLQSQYPFLDDRWARRLVRTFGTDAWSVLGDAKSAPDLGRDFGATLTEADLRWFHDHEWARTGDDALWRRTRLGLKLSPEQRAAVDAFMVTLQGEAGMVVAAGRA